MSIARRNRPQIHRSRTAPVSCVGLAVALLHATTGPAYAVPGDVTTLAGSGASGKLDATGTAATFNTPTGVATDSSANGYVADSMNNLTRKITPAGATTTTTTTVAATSATAVGPTIATTRAAVVSVATPTTLGDQLLPTALATAARRHG